MIHRFIEMVCRTPDRISAYSVRRQASTHNLHSRNALQVLRRRSLRRIYRCFVRRRKDISIPYRPSSEEWVRDSSAGCLRTLPGSSCRRHPKHDIAHPGASECLQVHASFAHIRSTNRYSGCRDGYHRSVPVLSRRTMGNPLGLLR